MCQIYIKDPNGPYSTYSAGSMIYVDWYLHETNPYYFTVTYLLGDNDRLERTNI